MPKPNTSDRRRATRETTSLSSPNLATDALLELGAKVDQHFNEKHRMYLRFAKNDRRENRNDNGVIDGRRAGRPALPFKRLNDAFVADHLATFSPTFIFNFRLSFNRFEENGFGGGTWALTRRRSVSRRAGDQFAAGHQCLRALRAWRRLQRPGSVSEQQHHEHHSHAPELHLDSRRADLARGRGHALDAVHHQKNEGNPFRLTADRGFTQKVFNVGDA